MVHLLTINFLSQVFNESVIKTKGFPEHRNHGCFFFSRVGFWVEWVVHTCTGYRPPAKWAWQFH